MIFKNWGLFCIRTAVAAHCGRTGQALLQIKIFLAGREAPALEIALLQRGGGGEWQNQGNANNPNIHANRAWKCKYTLGRWQ